MASGEESLVTGEMLGLFVVFGADIIIFVVLLAAGGVVTVWTAGLVTGAVLAVYAVWVLLRWLRLRNETDVDAVETLKERYAAGELSEAEFERRLDRILDTRGEMGDTINTVDTDSDSDAAPGASTVKERREEESKRFQ